MSEEENQVEGVPEMPRARGRAVVLKPGEKVLPPDLSLVPVLTGPNRRLAFRADHTTINCINEHLDRVGGTTAHVISPSDAIRALIQRGAAAYLADERNQIDDEDSDDE
jgi:hypothetical protein